MSSTPDPSPRRLTSFIERLTRPVDAGVRRVVRSHRLNPLPHAGTISVFLLFVVTTSGVYITLFYGFGNDAAHASVERMANHPIQTVIRTVHRYASAALVLTTLVHAWRITVAGRFRGPRRWAWATGVAALGTVVTAGVSGYWLVRDTRAQLIDEALQQLFGGLGVVRALYVRGLFGPSAGSGWAVVFLVWSLHLGLTALIGWFMWRHLRRSRLPWLPPRRWAVAMGVALLVVAIAVPADVLAPADLVHTATSLPLDPFVLFLLPLFLGAWAWPTVIGVVVGGVVAAGAPFLQRSSSPVVAVDEARCTGCDLCVADCPYRALRLVDRVTTDEGSGTPADRSIAVVDAAACVGCGICVGSCAFGALSLPGVDVVEPTDVEDRHVVVACARHLESGVVLPDVDSDGAPLEIVGVSCTGMVAPGMVGHLLTNGAARVQVVGCAPGECAFGLGNTIIDERLRGDRAPHVARRWSGRADRDWVSLGELGAAVAAPSSHPAVDGRQPPGGARWIAAVGLVGLSVIGVAALTRSRFSSDEMSGITVVVDHEPGATLNGYRSPSKVADGPVEIVTQIDQGVEQRHRVAPYGTAAIDIVTIDIAPGEHEVVVALAEGNAVTTLYSGVADYTSERHLLLQAVDVPPAPGVSSGREVFESREAGCSICHSLRPGDDGVGPSLAGVADRAISRVDGLDAATYLRMSIIEPDAYVVEGFRSGQMLDIYEATLTSDEIDALVVFPGSLGSAP